MSNLEIADKLADELRELIDIVLRAGRGEKEARSLLEDHIDGYHHALVIGKGKVQQLLADEEEGRATDHA